MSAVAVVGALLLPAITIFSPPGKFERRALRPRAQWAGRLDDRSLRELAPPAITDAEALAALWRAWPRGTGRPGSSCARAAPKRGSRSAARAAGAALRSGREALARAPATAFAFNRLVDAARAFR
jgi:hypothetical protein